MQRERSNQKKVQTAKGWYSESDMREELGWKPTHGCIIHFIEFEPINWMSTSTYIHGPMISAELFAASRGNASKVL